MNLWVSEFFKVTGPDGSPCHGGSGRWVPGEWREVTGEIVPCRNGLHLCRRDHLVSWLGPVIWRAEVDGEVVDAGDKVVARRARITERVETWTEVSARRFAADCAERVLPVFERVRPGDDRPRRAIEAARAFARGEIDGKALAAAWAAAGTAAGTAARDAARDAARAAAGTAARDAARDAAWDAAWAAAGAAAGTAARDAAGAAARAAARDAEHAWQTDRLWQYLDGAA